MNTLSALFLAAILAIPSTAAAPGAAKTFASARQAADALVEAASKDDVDGMIAILGPDGRKIVASGDDVRDKNDRARFAELAKTKLEVVTNKAKPTRATLKVGADGWPFPVPLVQAGGKWHFESKEGAREVLYRRVGQNELDAIQVCHGYVEAQTEYALESHDGSGLRQYAQKIISTSGKKDGLTWYDADGKPAGPIGDAIAKAIVEGYTKKGPYHGYYYMILTGQGPSARGGATDYVIQGKMLGGFALVAWPAEYRNTGVMTFMVNHDDVVFEKDLGKDTEKIASGMKLFNPDKSWRKTSDSGE